MQSTKCDPGKNIKSDQTEFIYMASLSRDSVFNVAALEVRRALFVRLVD